jgi:hypothetical protein
MLLETKIMEHKNIPHRNEQGKIKKLLVRQNAFRSSAEKPAVYERNNGMPVRLRNFYSGLAAQST